jgi:K+-transporting ATPase ATPase B chain
MKFSRTPETSMRSPSFNRTGAATLLRRNLLIYGLGGVIAPFIGIKLIDMLLVRLGMA